MSSYEMLMIVFTVQNTVIMILLACINSLKK